MHNINYKLNILALSLFKFDSTPEIFIKSLDNSETSENLSLSEIYNIVTEISKEKEIFSFQDAKCT